MVVDVAAVDALSKRFESQVLKVDEGLGLVFGWGIICTHHGKPYFDKGEHVVASTGARVKEVADGGFEFRATGARLTKTEAAEVVRRRDHIPEDAMLKAALDFATHSRVAKEMHEGEPIGTVVFTMPLTAEVKKAFGLRGAKTGLMIAVRPNDGVLAKFRDGTYTGFSVGGSRGVDELVVAA